MAEPSPFKYRAFISYSHRDKQWGEWLHRELERYRIDRDLVGRVTPAGPVPATLRPIFRDREDFSAGHSLTEQTLAALEGSQFLIAISSPNAAKSQYVNEEIRRFKALGRGNRVLPVIVDGEPGDPERECFPPAVRFRLGPDGALTDEREEPIAADARAKGDGKELAKLKLVAGLLGVGLDEIVRRAERERKRRARLRGGIAAGFVGLAVTASGGAAFGWQQFKSNDAFAEASLQRATDAVSAAVARMEQLGVTRTITLEALKGAEGLFALAEMRGQTPQLRYRKAWMQMQFAHNYAALGQTERQRDRALDAQRLLVGLATEQPDNLTFQREVSVAHHQVGNVLFTQGQVNAAFEAFREGLAISEHLVKLQPDNMRWQRDLSSAYHNIGDILRDRQNFDGALQIFRAALTIDEKLASAEPENGQFQRDLSVVYVKVGDILSFQNNNAEALKLFRASLAIRQRMAEAAPKNAAALRDLSAAHIRVGDILAEQNDHAGALESYSAALTIRRQLALDDPDNALRQRDLAVLYSKLADVLLAKGDAQEALRVALASAHSAERLTRLDPANNDWRRDLFVAYNKIARIMTAQRLPIEVVLVFRDLAAATLRPDNVLAADLNQQRRLAGAYDGLGEAIIAGDAQAALASFRIQHLVREHVAQRDPDGAETQRELALSFAKIASAQAQLRRGSDAMAALRSGRSILTTLTARMPNNAGWERDLANIDAQIAALEGRTSSSGFAPPQ